MTKRYQRLVGKLIYPSHTQPDMGFSMSVVSQYMNNPNEERFNYLEGPLCGEEKEKGLEIHTVVYFLDGLEGEEYTSF